LAERWRPPQLLAVNGSRIFEIDQSLARALEDAAEGEDGDTAVERILRDLGLDAPALIDDAPMLSPPLHALSLAIAQKCNLGCTYCYAGQGDFGGPAKNMPADTALRAVDLLFEKAAPGARFNLAFLGGEPLANRAVLRRATDYAAGLAEARGLSLSFSITTNGTASDRRGCRLFRAAWFRRDGQPRRPAR